MSGTIVFNGRAQRRARECYANDGVVPKGVRPVIAESWVRSSWSGVSAEGNEVELPYADGIDQESRLARAARSVLDEFARTVGDADIAIILADAAACIVDRRVNDGRLMRRLERYGGVPGACWNETVAGTNGIGTAAELRSPVTVFGSEHYIDCLQFYACVGVPIVHPVTRRLEGVLDASCAYDDVHPLLVSVTTKFAREIELGLLDQTHSRQRVVLERFLGVARRTRHPIVALDGELVITNSTAARILDPADHAILRERASEADPSGRDTCEVVLSDGRGGIMRCHDVQDGQRSIGTIIELKLETAVGAAKFPAESAQAATGAGDLGLAGRSPTFRRVAEATARRAQGHAPVLLAGEPGVGKLALISACFARYSPLTVIDCALAALEDQARWVGGIRRRLREPGTLVLRHLDELGAERMRMLAAILDEASRGERAARVVATCSAGDGVSSGLAALDAWFGEPIAVPSLADRREDIPDLVASLAPRHSRTDPPPRFDRRALQALMRSEWPGNVRELETLVAQLVGTVRVHDIRLEDLPPERSGCIARMQLRKIDRAERDLILEALRDAGGIKSEAAQILGIARSTLYRKMVQFNIDGVDPDG